MVSLWPHAGRQGFSETFLFWTQRPTRWAERHQTWQTQALLPKECAVNLSRSLDQSSRWNLEGHIFKVKPCERSRARIGDLTATKFGRCILVDEAWSVKHCGGHGVKGQVAIAKKDDYCEMQTHQRRCWVKVYIYLWLRQFVTRIMANIKYKMYCSLDTGRINTLTLWEQTAISRDQWIIYVY